MQDNNVSNLPVIDIRVVDFSNAVEEFVREKGEDLPMTSIIGVLETLKHIFLAECMVELVE